MDVSLVSGLFNHIISTLEDLEGIASLGFRGEALASISSVSRLTLTSRTAEQDEGWQVYAEGRDMSPVVQPASHPQGTTVEVLDLFYNTPARRRFLKSDKTESGHTEDVVRCMALSRPELGFTLTHNGKRILHCAAGKSGASAASRLAAICGKDFADRAVCLEWSHHSMQLSGWVVPPQPDGKSFDVQYFFVNGRAVRVRVIMHAVRQAYGQIPDGGQQPGYVLYLELEAEQVDVNVHPAKQEVRFHESRLVHDFICQGIRCTPDGHGVVFNGVPSLIREQPLTLLLGRLAEWLSREDAPDADAGSARVSRWLAANCEYAGVKDMAGLSVFCRQLRETPDALLEDGMLKPGLLTEIPLEEYTDMPEQNPPC